MFAPMPYDVIPHNDLVESRIPDDPRVRRELIFRWANRVLGQHAPAALRQLGYEAEATELGALGSESFDAARASELLDVSSGLHLRVEDAEPERDHQDLATFVLACVNETATVIGLEAGALESVLSTWIEGVGPGTVIQESEDELVEGAKLRVIEVGAYARTIAHIVGGERGYVAEVAQQYADLYPDGQGGGSESTWGSLLVSGKRYRVFTAFTDLDGVHHPWGESWRFDGCTYSPTTCELLLNVSEGVQLDPKGRPGPEIAVAPFRLAITVGERPGNVPDVIRSIIVED